MSLDEAVAELAQQAGEARDEARAQALARRYREALLQATPGTLPQSQFLCILAAVLGRFARDMAEGDPVRLGEALAGLVRRHAGRHAGEQA